MKIWYTTMDLQIPFFNNSIKYKLEVNFLAKVSERLCLKAKKSETKKAKRETKFLFHFSMN